MKNKITDHIRKSVTMMLLACCLCCGQSQPLVPRWEAALESNVQRLEVTDWSVLIAAANGRLYGVNPENGEKLWKAPELMEMKFRHNYRKGS